MRDVRYGWMVVRLCLPAIGFACGALIVELVAQNFSGHAMLAELAAGLTLIGAVLLLATAGAVMVAVIRYWRWERGDSIDCVRCGGLLGIERSGRWGPYRKCLACGRNESAKTYI